MILEIVATCLDDAIAAEQHGADRIELITAATEDGLTPGIGLVKLVARRVRIPVTVIVRPHSRSFVCGPHDLETMVAEIRAIAAAGAAGVVIGAVTPERTIDERALEVLLEAADGLDVTFHRAFDELDDQVAGLRTLARYPAISRVLTSAGQRPAAESVDGIRRLVEATRGGPLRIMAGNGLKPEGIERFIAETGVTEVHVCSGVRVGGSKLAPIDPVRLRALADAVHGGG